MTLSSLLLGCIYHNKCFFSRERQALSPNFEENKIQHPLTFTDLDLAGLDLGVGADVDDRVGWGVDLHGEGPNGGPAEAVAGGVPEHDAAHEQHDPVNQPQRQVPV